MNSKDSKPKSAGDSHLRPGNLIEQAEEALRRSREEFKELFDNAPVGFHEVDTEGRIVRINNTELKMLGYTAEELLGKFVWKISADEETSRKAALAKLAGTLVPASEGFERTFRRKDGSTIPVWINDQILRGKDGVITGARATIQDITERKRAEIALNYERDLLRTLLNTSPDNIYFKDTQSRFVKCSETQARHFGLKSPDELAGKTDFDFYPETDARPKYEDEQEIIRTGRPIISKEELDKQKTGQIRWVSSTKMPWIDITGKIVGIIGISRDITERKRAEETLRESEERFSGAFEHAPIGMALVSPDGRWLKVNQAVCDLVGYSEAELLARTFQDITHPDDLAADLENVRQMLASEIQHYQMEKRYFHRRGHIINILLNVSLVRDNQGRPRYFISQIQDITERKKADQKFKNLLEATPDSMVIVNRDSEIVLANFQTFKTFGWSREELMGKKINVLVPERFRARHPEFQRGFMEQPSPRPMGAGLDLHGLRKDGTEFPVEISLSPLETAEGLLVMTAIRDITERRKLEEQFRQAQKMEGIGRLAGGVAHDFNNILAVIQMQADLLKTDAGTTSAQLELASGIAKAAQRAANLTRQLLLFGRKQTMQLRNLDLNESVNELTQMLRRTLGEDVELQFKFSMQPLFIHADTTMMDQVLMNLAVNARDAMPKGGRLVFETSAIEFDEITAAQTTPARPGSFVCLSVSDTGSGIPPEILPHIFEPFFTTKGVGKGSGLGLATVFGIIQQHKGWINVYSEAGRGTTFRIYLPRLAEVSRQKSEPSESSAERGGNETILLVEDEEFLRESAGQVLSQLGYRVLEAANGNEALDIWKQHRNEIKLLLTDLVMPGGMTGMELGGKLKEENPKLKVIYISGYSAEIAGRDFPLEEGVDFLTKPFAARKLAQTVRNSLDSI